MKKLRILALFFFIFNSPLAMAKDSGVDVEISLADLQGGGSNNLNSIKKLTDNGVMKSNSGEKLNYEIHHSYEIQKGNAGALTLSVHLILKKKENNDKPWNKKISISKDGKQIFKPFDGIIMTIDSKGFSKNT